jgi:hypothetical protein
MAVSHSRHHSILVSFRIRGGQVFDPVASSTWRDPEGCDEYLAAVLRPEPAGTVYVVSANVKTQVTLDPGNLKVVTTDSIAVAEDELRCMESTGPEPKPDLPPVDDGPEYMEPLGDGTFRILPEDGEIDDDVGSDPLEFGDYGDREDSDDEALD